MKQRLTSHSLGRIPGCSQRVDSGHCVLVGQGGPVQLGVAHVQQHLAGISQHRHDLKTGEGRVT